MPSALATTVTSPQPTAQPHCRVVLLGGKELMRVGLRTILNAQPDVTVVGEAVQAREFRDIARLARPNVIVADISMAATLAADTISLPGQTGRLPLVMLCLIADSADLDLAVRIGARGVLLRSDDSCHVVDAVRAVVAGQGFLAPSVAGYMLDQLAMRLPSVEPVTAIPPACLTVREREVLQLLASGLTTAQAAEVLGRSRATIKSHVSHLLSKLGLQDRAQAIAFAYQTGLVTNHSAKASVTAATVSATATQ